MTMAGARLTDLLEPNNLRLLFGAMHGMNDLAVAARDDAATVKRLLRALASRQERDREPRVPRTLFPAWRPIDARGLRGKRIGLVASGGSGALSSLCGVRRAFEEAGLDVVHVSACSGAVLFAILWALGMTGKEMAAFWLGLRTRDYVDPDWTALARAPLRRFGGWTGILAGDGLERTFRARFGDRTLGELAIPLSAPVWNVDLNRVETIGTRETPELPIARAVRVAISIPLFVEPVRIGGHLYGDGGVVDVFPAQPTLDAGVDLVVGVNCYFPRDFEGEDLSGWEARSFSILRASAQLRSCVHLELARARAKSLDGRLVLLHPVPYTEIRGARFYETFVDRSRWPSFMRMGHEEASAVLERLAATVTQGDATYVTRPSGGSPPSARPSSL